MRDFFLYSSSKWVYAKKNFIHPSNFLYHADDCECSRLLIFFCHSSVIIPKLFCNFAENIKLETTSG